MKSVAFVSRPFHARYSALAKTYFYLVDDGEGIDPFAADFAWRVSGPRLSLPDLRRAAAPLVGRHDFLSYCVERKPDTVRTLTSVRASRAGGRVKIALEGDGFLRGMARMLVGAMVAHARGERPADAIARSLASPDKGRGGPRAPAAGLYLARVRY